MMSRHKLFFRQFQDNFFQIGAVLPSSPATARAMVAYLAKKQGLVRVLEAGAGTGAFTGQIVSSLEAGDVLDAVEINPTLMAELQQRFQREPIFQVPEVEVQFIRDDVRNLPSENQYDYIIFSLPLTNFPPPMVQELLDLMIGRLKPGGIFSYIKYIFLGRVKYLFSNATVKADTQTNQQIIHTFANRYQIERRTVLWNVPPAWIYYWQKPTG